MAIEPLAGSRSSTAAKFTYECALQVAPNTELLLDDDEPEAEDANEQ